MVGNWWGKKGELEEPHVRESGMDILVWEDIDTSCLRECHMLPAGMWNPARGKVELELKESSFQWPSGFPSRTLNVEKESQVKRGSREGWKKGWKRFHHVGETEEKSSINGQCNKKHEKKKETGETRKSEDGRNDIKDSQGLIIVMVPQCGPKPPVLPGKCSISHFNN